MCINTFKKNPNPKKITQELSISFRFSNRRLTKLTVLHVMMVDKIQVRLLISYILFCGTWNYTKSKNLSQIDCIS